MSSSRASRVSRPSARLLESLGKESLAQPAAPKAKGRKSGDGSKKAASKTESTETASFDGPGSADANRLYCVCLGADDSTPMIQCESCSNWFHFKCIDLTPKQARKIQSYYCEICTEVGAGVTTRLPSKKPSHDPTFDFINAPSSSSEGEDFGPDGGLYQLDTLEPDLDFAAADDPVQKAKKATRQPWQLAGRRRKSKKAEGFDDSADEEDDDDYAGEGDIEVERLHKPKVPKSPKRRESGNIRKESYSGPPAMSHLDIQKTRNACFEQLIKWVGPLLAADVGEDAQESARTFVTDMESEIFEQFGDTDLRGTKLPGKPYLTKFRSVLYNLKSNENFKSRIASGQLTASEAVNVRVEDLMTSQQRSMAEDVRAKSLKDSVKTATEAPKLKRTHKGEEAVDEFMSLDPTSYAVRQRAEALEAEDSIMRPPATPSLPPESPRIPEVPDTKHLRQSSGTFGEPTRASFLVKPEDIGFEGEAHTKSEEPSESIDQPHTPQDIPQSPPKASFDFDSIWGNYKAPVKTEGDEEAAADQDNGDGDGEDPDPFEVESGKGNDMDIDDILRDADKAEMQESTTPVLPPPKSKVDRTAAMRALPVIWSGDVLMPEEGGYPCVAVQVAGRPLGPSRQLWSSVLPEALHMTGRIPAKSSSAYMVKCTEVSTRELSVIALLPDLEGPTEAAPSKPTAERAEVKMNHLVDYFTSRQRHGVCPPADSRKNFIKDLYIVPLRPEDNVPSYIEGLDEQLLGGPNERSANILLAVLVLQKNALPTYELPTLVEASAQTSAGQSSHMPDAATQALAGFTSEALQSLLAQPSLATLLSSQPLLPPSLSQPTMAPMSSGLPPQNNMMVHDLVSNPALLQSLLGQQPILPIQPFSGPPNPSNPAFGSSPLRPFQPHPPQQQFRGGPPRQRSRSPPGRRDQQQQQQRRYSRENDFQRRDRDPNWDRSRR